MVPVLVQVDTLPCAQCETPLADGDGETRTHEGTLHMNTHRPTPSRALSASKRIEFPVTGMQGVRVCMKESSSRQWPVGLLLMPLYLSLLVLSPVCVCVCVQGFSHHPGTGLWSHGLRNPMLQSQGHPGHTGLCRPSKAVSMHRYQVARA